MAFNQPKVEKEKKNKLEFYQNWVFENTGDYDAASFFKKFKILLGDFDFITNKNQIKNEKDKALVEEWHKEYNKLKYEVEEEVKNNRVEPEAFLNDPISRKDWTEDIKKGRIFMEARLRFMENNGLIIREKKWRRDYKVKGFGVKQKIFPYTYFSWDLIA